MKTLPERIAYYTRKVALRSNVHPSKALPKSYAYRSERLRLYKKLLHEQIEREEWK